MAFVYLNPLKQQLDNARQQRAMLETQRQALHQNLNSLNQRIAEWDSYIAAAAPLARHDDQQLMPGQITLADLCRKALDAYGDWMTAQQVRSYLVQLGIRFDYRNEMAVLHNTLGRVGQSRPGPLGTTIYARKGLP